MLSRFAGRDEFSVGASVAGVVAAALATSMSTGWGIPVSATLIVAMVVRARWRSMPPILLLVWVGIPIVVTEAAETGSTGYFVATVALAIVAADGMSPGVVMMSAGVLLSPLALWAARVGDYVTLGPWSWIAGMSLGWLFGTVIGRQWVLIDQLNATREQLKVSAANSERRRIAHDMHDVVGHNFSVVLLHISGARTVLDTDPVAAAAALRQAEEVGRRGMEDLRQTISLMRSGEVQRPPVATGAEIEALIERYRRAGLDIDLHVTGPVDDISTAQGMVVHDTLRESLTNCAKHGATSAVEIRLTNVDGSIGLRIQNVRTKTVTRSDGSGLDGMSSRIVALGGSFDAGPHGQDWVVNAHIPDATATEASQSIPAASSGR